jgi:Xaa-Pro aminopeptidase
MPTANVFLDRLNALSARLKADKVDLYLQPMADEFQNEYLPAHTARLPWLTGFTGSAGLGAFWAENIGARHHSVFVDGRYTIQAARELKGSGAQSLGSGEVSLAQWLGEVTDGPITIGFDPWLVTYGQMEHWKNTTGNLPISWRPMGKNPVDAIWKDRPPAPTGGAVEQPLELAGKSFEEKRDGLVEQMVSTRLDTMIITLADGVNWLLNIRGSDIPFNPLLISYFILKNSGEGILFRYEQTFSQSVEKQLKDWGITCIDPTILFSRKAPVLSAGLRVGIDPSSASLSWWEQAEREGWTIVPMEDPTLLPKACKNAAELEGMRAAHRRDGLALTRFLCWLDGQVSSGRMPDELGIAAQLEEFRASDNRYRGPSFATIAGSGPNGAIVHYRADAQSNRKLRKGELLLLDSGGQYEDGTTDVTRTVAIAGASPAMIEHTTRVLKGHIAIARAKFPEGTTGSQLDALARQYLWEAGLDYDHGTGHGVGAYLCVHEGPQRISKRGGGAALKPGMILSNEPGYYEEGKYGIRIESLVTVVEVGRTFQNKKLLGFETLTLAPIDTRLVDISMLSGDERNWLNDYHRQVFKAHEAGLDDSAKSWLSQATRAV